MLILIVTVTKPKIITEQLIFREIKKVVLLNFETFDLKETYYHSASHDFNPALSKACDIPDIQYVLDTIKTGGIFSKYFPKRQVLLEQCIKQRKLYVAEEVIQDIRFKKVKPLSDGMNTIHPFFISSLCFYRLSKV